MSDSPNPLEIPYQFSPTATAAGIRAEHGHLEPGEETGVQVTIAGRLMLRRVQGKLAFGTLDDGTDRIQLFSLARLTPSFDEFCSLSLGDWIGVTGEVIATKRGELSVKVESWQLLAEARRSFPDKWHGITDPDTRYRQRYVDLWVTPESRATFALRSRAVSLMRRWLEDRGFMEVETPLLHPILGGAAAKPFVTHHNALDADLFLRIAPELYLKRLIAGGFPRVFEIGRTFRNEGMSTRHNPEFTMLELYQAYADYSDIMELVEQLIEYLAIELVGTTDVTHDGRPLSLAAPWRRATMTELITEVTGDRLAVTDDLESLREVARGHGVEIKDSYGTGKLILEIYEKTVEPTLWEPIFVIDYPVEVSPLARIHRSDPNLTERFEGFIAGSEVCNAFSELTDPVDQRERFEAQVRLKDEGDDEAMGEVDEDYLRALEYGLPPTGGLGIGIDRLIMMLADVSSIRDVVLFPTLRPEQA